MTNNSDYNKRLWQGPKSKPKLRVLLPTSPFRDEVQTALGATEMWADPEEDAAGMAWVIDKQGGEHRIRQECEHWAAGLSHDIDDCRYLCGAKSSGGENGNG